MRWVILVPSDTDSEPGEMEVIELSEVVSLVCGRFLYSRRIAHQSLGDHREEKTVPYHLLLCTSVLFQHLLATQDQLPGPTVLILIWLILSFCSLLPDTPKPLQLLPFTPKQHVPQGMAQELD